MICQHHWLIASPNGAPLCSGRCKMCGESKDFCVVDPRFTEEGIHNWAIKHVPTLKKRVRRAAELAVDIHGAALKEME